MWDLWHSATKGQQACPTLKLIHILCKGNSVIDDIDSRYYYMREQQMGQTKVECCIECDARVITHRNSQAAYYLCDECQRKRDRTD